MILDERNKQRFWSKVAILEPQDCWPWLRGRFTDGYGQFRLRNRKVGAHRVAWAITHNAPIWVTGGGPKIVRHICDNPLCCNPAHLRMGTYQDNANDAVRRGRTARGEAHGKAKLTEESVLEIRRLRNEGRTPRSLTEQFGVSRSTLDSARRNWKWLESKTALKVE